MEYTSMLPIPPKLTGTSRSSRLPVPRNSSTCDSTSKRLEAGHRVFNAVGNSREASSLVSNQQQRRDRYHKSAATDPRSFLTSTANGVVSGQADGSGIVTGSPERNGHTHGDCPSTSTNITHKESDPLPDVKDSAIINTPNNRSSRPSLSERTVESLALLPGSPAPRRRKSGFFSPLSPMGPPSRPASSRGNNKRAVTSGGTPGRRSDFERESSSRTLPRKFGASARQVGDFTPLKKNATAGIKSDLTSRLARNPTTNVPPSNPFNQSQRDSSRCRHDTSASKTPTKPSNKARQGTNTKSTPSFKEESNRSANVSRYEEQASGSEDSPGSARKTINSSTAFREQIAKAKSAKRRISEKHSGGGNQTSAAPFDLDIYSDPFNKVPPAENIIRKRIQAARCDGRLNIAALGLKDLPDEILTMYDYDATSPDVSEWTEAIDLTRLNAADNDISVISDIIFPDIDAEDVVTELEEKGLQFRGLEILDFHGNKLQALPKGLKKLEHLTHLNLSRNLLEVEVLDIISDIDSLRELKLAENQLQGFLPDTLGRLKRLEVLDLHHNKIRGLPDSIDSLAHLRVLNIGSNELTSLPIAQLSTLPLTELLAPKNALDGTLFALEVSMPRLHTLDIASNAISCLISSDNLDLPALQVLNVSSNRLSSLPDLSLCKDLLTLFVEGNALTSLPENFTQLSNLRSADFTANSLTKLDDKIASMDRLDVLRLGANPLRERKLLTLTADEIKDYLRGRVETRLDNGDNGPDLNDLNEESNGSAAALLPTSWILKPSGVLHFSSDFRSETERKAFGEFAASNHIRQVHMNNMHLKTIPPALELVSSLQVLDLSNNEIEAVLTGPLQLPSLSELRVASNRMTSLDTLTKFLSAPNLQRLDVSCNHIRGPLPCLRATFAALRVLIASDNQISEITAESLRGFTTANLSRNDMAHLPPEIGLLSDTLVNFDVNANMFRVPNHRILEKGTQIVLAWLRDKIPNVQ